MTLGRHSDSSSLDWDQGISPTDVAAADRRDVLDSHNEYLVTTRNGCSRSCGSHDPDRVTHVADWRNAGTADASSALDSASRRILRPRLRQVNSTAQADVSRCKGADLVLWSRSRAGPQRGSGVRAERVVEDGKERTGPAIQTVGAEGWPQAGRAKGLVRGSLAGRTPPRAPWWFGKR
jgi:hypothetical protein